MRIENTRTISIHFTEDELNEIIKQYALTFPFFNGYEISILKISWGSDNGADVFVKTKITP